MSDGSGGAFFLRLHSAMLGTYRSRADLEMMIRLSFNESLDMYARNADLRVQVFELCDWFQRRSDLDELLRAAFTHAPPGSVEIRSLFYQRFPPPLPDPAHDASAPPVAFFAAISAPYGSCCLGPDTVFVNRMALRSALHTIENGGSRRVLVVTGADHSGKSFTHELIQHVAIHLKRRIVWIDLKRDLPAEGGAAALATRILTRMGLPVPASDARRVLPLIDAMVGAMNHVKGKWWIVLDGFERGSVAHEVRELISELAIQIGLALPKLRLALLGYDEPIVSRLAERVHPESIKAIDEAALVHFFQCAFEEHGHAANPEAVSAAAKIVWDRLPPSGPDRLRGLNQLLREAVQKLFFAGVAS